MASTGKASPESLALAAANNQFAVELHRLLAAEKKNVFFSPFSISSGMAMVLCGAEGETETEMRRALAHEFAGIAKKDVASIVQRTTADLVAVEDSYTLASANTVLSKKGLPVKDTYKSVLREMFKALLLEVDFENIENVISQINDWVKKETKDMIPKFIEKLDPGAVMVLLNAVYFKGSWMQKFDKKSTASEKFFNNGVIKNAKKVKMMHMKGTFSYAENDSFKALQLPYVGEKIAMLLLLPNNNDGLAALEASLTPSFVENLCKTMRKSKVNVTLPRFSLDYSKELVPSFKQMGINKLFNPSAELGGAFNAAGLCVSDIFHKAVLDVNEEGSEAAATTMIVVALRCAPKQLPEATFIVNHPFALVIYDINTNLILFMGRVQEL